MTSVISRPAGHQAAPLVGSPDAPTTRPTSAPLLPDDGVSGGSTSPAAATDTTPKDLSPQGTLSTGRHVPSDTRGTGAAGSNVPDPTAIDGPVPKVGSLLDPALCLAADVLDDIERVRTANENRLRQLTRTAVDSDGEERGFGLDESHPDVARLAAMVATLVAVEHDAVLELQRKLRKHPLGAWVKTTKGVGEKQGARLLAAIGDPYWNSAKDAPRTVSALWAYCGLHVLPAGHLSRDDQCPSAGRAQLLGSHLSSDSHCASAAGDQHRDTDQYPAAAQQPDVGVTAKRRKGERANWSTKAKTRAYLIAESCMKQLAPQCRLGHITAGTELEAIGPACECSPYRVVYDTRRAHTATTHPEWTDGHSHNDALRVAFEGNPQGPVAGSPRLAFNPGGCRMITFGTGPHGPAGPHPSPTHPGPGHPPEPAPRPRFAHPTEPQPGQPVDPRVPDAPAPQPFVAVESPSDSGGPAPSRPPG